MAELCRHDDTALAPDCTATTLAPVATAAPSVAPLRLICWRLVAHCVLTGCWLGHALRGHPVSPHANIGAGPAEVIPPAAQGLLGENECRWSAQCMSCDTACQQALPCTASTLCEPALTVGAWSRACAARCT